MNSILEMLDKIVDCSNGKGYFHNVNYMLIRIGFTDKERLSVEKFLFDPTRTNALEALDLTPKSYEILKHYMQEKEVIDAMANIIVTKKNSYAYIKTLLTKKKFVDVLRKLRRTSAAAKIENASKRYEMDKKLQNDRE
jgi:hypothetical protein